MQVRLYLLQNPNHPRLCFVKDEVVNFVIPVNKCANISRLRCRLFEKCNHFIKVWDLAHWHSRLNIHVASLSQGERLEELKLAVVEAGSLAKRLKVYGLGGDAVELG